MLILLDLFESLLFPTIGTIVSCTRSACISKSLRASLILLLYFDVNPAELVIFLPGTRRRQRRP